MSKLRVGLVFGGRSAEHEVSVRSARSIAQALDPAKYELVPLAISKDGSWNLENGAKFLDLSGSLQISIASDDLVPSFKRKGLVDVIFPIVHGPYGEDGTLQGLFKLAGIPFVGPSVLGSAVGMDKDVMKRLLRDAGIPIPKFHVFKRKEKDSIKFEALSASLGATLFVKPANLGSSVGISRVTNASELKAAIEEAFRFDTKILIEEGIIGREIEVSVMGNESPEASIPGEIDPQKGFYDYEAKYISGDAAKLMIPAELSPELVEKARKMAIKTFEVLCCEGMSRVDLFLTPNGEYLVNEINTLPGFTSISMYPKLWEASGVPYSVLIDKLINFALERQERDSKLLTSIS